MVLVSGLYPPNFVSGATLHAQQLAHAFLERGHDVRVFAGRLEEGRRPLEQWDEVDDRGLLVSWIVTTPWFGFGDVTNYSNPSAERAFSQYLRLHRPDIVHLHAIQGLGGGLTRIASESGAKVVVTMHDVWWRCARHFLVDTDLKPCCPVVSAGVCGCQVDRPWLEARTRWLDAQLRFAHLILSPSSIMADLLAANGIDPSKLAVDENGVPAKSPAARPPRAKRGSDGTTRFLYAGGPNELKGSHILIEAAEKLRGVPGWKLDAYGMSGFAEGRPLDMPSVELREAFSPEEAPSIFASADLLVLPSIARESFSVLTREALSSGLPVITTDSLGPEEVVQHGVNGLVVPSGDSTALASAMRRCVEDPNLIETLREGTGDIRLRSLDHQADGLIQRYDALLHTQAETKDHPVGRVLFICGIDGAPLRYRAWLPVEALALLGVRSWVRHYQDPEIQSLAERCDVIVVYRAPATKRLLEVLDRASVPVMFDVDDLIFDPEVYDQVPALRTMEPATAALWLQGVRRYRLTMESCDRFIGSTSLLCSHAASTVGLPAHLFENGVGSRTGRLSDEALRRDREPGPVRIGYLSGTDTHGPDWEHVEPAIVAALESHEDAELWLVGHLPESRNLASFGSRVKRFPFMRWESLPHLLRQIDINIAPLAPGSIFNEAKSAIKWLEAALVATPTIASPTSAFRDAIRHGEDGILATSPDDWIDALTHLMGDELERKRLGTLARRNALFRWSPWVQGPRYLSILEEAIEGQAGHAKPAASGIRSSDLVHDEPPKATYLEPYALNLQAGPGEPVRATEPLRWNQSLGFELPRAPSGLVRIDLYVATFGGPGVGLTLTLRDRASGSLRVSKVPAHRVADNSWVPFYFRPAWDTGQDWLAEVKPTGLGRAGKVALWVAEGGRYTAAGKDHPGTPCLKLWAFSEFDRGRELTSYEGDVVESTPTGVSRVLPLIREHGLRGLASRVVKRLHALMRK